MSTTAENHDIKRIPSVTKLMELAKQSAMFTNIGTRKSEVRQILSVVRNNVLSGEPCPSHSQILNLLSSHITSARSSMITPVINATGIALHTNLGRSPISAEILKKVSDICEGYCNLELDLQTGGRGKRADSVNDLLKEITGCEASICVNNGAAAIYMALKVLAAGKEVIVSRGELVQIGGGFKVPDILRESGATLVEVGTTNITTALDYEHAITENTAMILKIHQSNFYIEGHTKAAGYSELGQLCKNKGLPFVVDLGSGAFDRWQGYDANHEPTVQDTLKHGADLVTFSGDKLVGGPQAGLLVGRETLINKLKKSPLYRIMRTGRMITVTMQETLKSFVDSKNEALSLWKMLEPNQNILRPRINAVHKSLQEAGVFCEIVQDKITTGGGSAPRTTLETTVIAVSSPQIEKMLQHLRWCQLPIIPRIEDGKILVDLRTVLAKHDTVLVKNFVSFTQSSETLN